MNNPDNNSTHRILVVDDNPAIHEDFRKILCSGARRCDAALAGFETRLFGKAPSPSPGAILEMEMDSAFQGQEALSKVEAANKEGRPYSVAFVDVRMPPGWDGIETVHRIWKDHPALQIVICTACSDHPWEDILHQFGETDSLVVLKKPFDNVEVLQLALALTRKWRRTQQANARLADLDERVRQRTRELVDANHLLEREIHQRSTIESALRESEERFRKAFETVSVAVGILRASDQRYLDVNQSFVQLSGYPREMILGKTPKELNLLARPELCDEVVEALRAGKQVRNVEVAIQRQDGELRRTLVSVESLQIGNDLCMLSAMLDVTEKQQLEDQLRHAQKIEAVGQLAAGVAHDFNNLLTVIHGYTSLQLAKGTLESDTAKAFQQIKQASERASALTRQLLAFSRKQIVQRRTLNLSATVGRLQGMITRLIGASINLESDCSATLPPIHADESTLEQVIMNLVINARDAMPTGGRLRLSTGVATIGRDQAELNPDARPGSFVVFTVSDSGCGMDTKTLSRIFEPFFTTKPIGRGTGLGLSTVYGIVKQHEGWISVQSQPAHGSTFQVFLPVNAIPAGPESPIVPSERPPGSPISGSETILVVEDQPEVREYITSVLSSHGYRVLQATSGAEALLNWTSFKEKIHLLFTDMVMPDGVSGSLLAERLIRRHPDLRVIYASGYSAEIVAKGESLREGLNFLSKPFTQDKLLATVRNALDSRVERVELVPAGAR